MTVDEKLNAIAWYLLDLTNTIKQTARETTGRLDKIMAAQDDINAAVTAVTGLLTDIQGQVATLATDLQQIQALLASGQTVDTSALDAAVANVAGIQSALDSGVSAVTAVASPPPPTT